MDEIWTYHLVGDQMRFTSVYKAPQVSRPARRPDAAKKPTPHAAEKAHKPAAKPAVRKPEVRKAVKKTRAVQPAAKPAASKSARPKHAAVRPAA